MKRRERKARHSRKAVPTVSAPQSVPGAARGRGGGIMLLTHPLLEGEKIETSVSLWHPLAMAMHNPTNQGLLPLLSPCPSKSRASVPKKKCST